MRLRAFLSLAVLLPLSFLTVSSVASIDASAALTGGRYMSVSEARAVFGDEITGTYWDGSDYVSVTFRYNSEFTLGTVESENSYESVFVGARALKYTASSIFPSSEVGQITFDLQPQYSIFDTTQIHSFIALYYSGNYLSSTYDSPNWDWVVNGSRIHTENSDMTASNSGYHAYCGESGSYGAHYTFVPFDFRSQSETSGYSLRACFYGNSSGGGLSYLLLGLPYVDNNATGATGTLPDSGGGGSSGGDINVNIDLTETNEELQTQTGLINSIVSWIGQFFFELSSTVRSWFIPSQNFFENWIDELMDTITDHFLPHLPLNGQIENIAADLAAALGEGGVQAVNFPAIDVPGTDFSMPSYSVPLVPSGMEDSVEYLKLMIDCLCTVWVFNMVLNRIHAIIVGETSVEVIDHAD